MDDGIKLAPQASVSENQGAQGRPVEGTSRIKDTVTEHPDNGSESITARLHHLPGKEIGVDDDCPQCPQSGRHLRFSRGDSAS